MFPLPGFFLGFSSHFFPLAYFSGNSAAKKCKDFIAPLGSKNTRKEREILLLPGVIIATQYLVVIECFLTSQSAFRFMTSSELHRTRGSLGFLLIFQMRKVKPGKVKQLLPKSQADLSESKAGIVSTILCQANFDPMKALFKNLI